MFGFATFRVPLLFNTDSLGDRLGVGVRQTGTILSFPRAQIFASVNEFFIVSKLCVDL
jgi:hypothetical protein